MKTTAQLINALVILSTVGTSVFGQSVHLGGEHIWRQTYVYDLDTSLQNCPDEDCDIWYEAETQHEKYVSSLFFDFPEDYLQLPEPRPDLARFSTTSFDESPGFLGCLTAEVALHRIDVRELPVGTYLCVHTTEGRVSELMVTDAAELGRTDSMTIQFTTWNHDVPGDFDADGLLTVSDIDLLSSRIRRMEFSSPFDLERDNLLDNLDRVEWVESLASTFSGDTNLDKRVDVPDFLRLSASFGQTGGWGEGDFDGDGTVGFPDFLILSENFGQIGSAPESVPEPSGLALPGMFLVCVGAARRRGRR